MSVTLGQTPSMAPSAEQFRELFLLDPEVTYLNHGSFGALPRPVFEAQNELRRELELEPVLFLARKLRLDWRESGRASPGSSERRRETTLGSSRT